MILRTLYSPNAEQTKHPCPAARGRGTLFTLLPMKKERIEEREGATGWEVETRRRTLEVKEIQTR